MSAGTSFVRICDLPTVIPQWSFRDAFPQERIALSSPGALPHQPLARSAGAST